MSITTEDSVDQVTHISHENRSEDSTHCEEQRTINISNGLTNTEKIEKLN